MESLFLQAARGAPTPRPPIWLMRQAGRYLPEYRKLREGLSMLEAVSRPEVAIEATLQPIRRFGFDAAILFSDLTVPFTGMGAPFEIVEGRGPVLDTAVRTESQVDQLHTIDPEECLGFVLEAIRGLKKELSVPLIGFTGAPFTLACYLIEGGPSRDLAHTKAMMFSNPALFQRVLNLLADVVVAYLTAQVKAGADAVQLFDSWVGALDRATYRTHIFPVMERIFRELKPTGVPVIHFGTGNPDLLPLMAEAGGDVIGVDYRISLTDAASRVPGKVLQGNFDPALLYGSKEIVAAQAKEIVKEGQKLPGHIFNLGHGILPQTPLENVQVLAETVKSFEFASGVK